MSSSTGNEKKSEDWMAPPSDPEPAILPPSYEEATGQPVVQLEDTEDIIQIRDNEAGLISRPGASGKFYCGGDLGSAQCSCCRGCGPTNGCNCAPCQKLDIATRKLPNNYYVNREGAACRRSSVSGRFHCGRKLRMGSGVRCGPDVGEQCQWCQVIQEVQVQNGYRGIWSQETEESTAHQGITNAAAVISVVEDPITTQINEAGRASQPGESGKFYCGRDLGDDLCSCCSGCGPTSGCNCAPCQKLDITSRDLPLNYYVNRDGAPSRRSHVSGLFHCGRKLSVGSTVRCGPDGEEQCQWCQLIQVQAENAYKGIWTQDPEESTDQRGITNAAAVEDVIGTKTNEASQTSLLGESGKFYCGGDLGEDLCSCCSGCGPTAGCNCAPCQKLDIVSRKLPKNYYVNRVGVPCRKSRMSGLFHCGRKLSVGSTARCGPNVGEQCEWCKLIQVQAENAYRGIMNRNLGESTTAAADFYFINSLGEAAQHQGNIMGEYYPTGQSIQGFPIFRKLSWRGDTYLYVNLMNSWMVGPNVNTTAGLLYHPDNNPTPDRPPLVGWKYVKGGVFHEDSSLTVTPINVEKVDDVIATKINEAGQISRPGVTGKFYCEEDLGSAQCMDGCSGCGPTNGCNCAPCQKLDIATRKLPKNYYVNREGATCRRSQETGLIYCGRKCARSGDGYCGPNNGPQCQMCSVLQTQVEDAGYRALW